MVCQTTLARLLCLAEHVPNTIWEKSQSSITLENTKGQSKNDNLEKLIRV